MSLIASLLKSTVVKGIEDDCDEKTDTTTAGVGQPGSILFLSFHRYLCASSAFAGIFSFRDSVIEGVHICDFFLRGDRERFLDELRDPDSGPLRTASLSLTGVSRDGRHLALSVWLSPVEGNPDLFLAFFEDKSDSQKDQNKIEKLEHQAAIGTFTSGVAHEFNNVLAGIRGYACNNSRICGSTASTFEPFPGR